MSCTRRMRRPPISKLCGDSNSSTPNADCARDEQPCVIAVVLAEHAGERHVRVLERLERERRAVVAGVQDHPDAAPPASARTNSAIAGRRSCVSAISPTRIRFPSVHSGSAISQPHEIVVASRARDHGESIAVDQHLGRPRTAVVVRRHRVSVRADVAHDEQSPGCTSSSSRSSARKSPLSHTGPTTSTVARSARSAHRDRCDDTRRSATAAAARSSRRRRRRSPCRRCACDRAPASAARRRCRR